MIWLTFLKDLFAIKLSGDVVSPHTQTMSFSTK